MIPLGILVLLQRKALVPCQTCICQQFTEYSLHLPFAQFHVLHSVAVFPAYFHVHIPNYLRVVTEEADEAVWRQARLCEGRQDRGGHARPCGSRRDPRHSNFSADGWLKVCNNNPSKKRLSFKLLLSSEGEVVLWGNKFFRTFLSSLDHELSRSRSRSDSDSRTPSREFFTCRRPSAGRLPRGHWLLRWRYSRLRLGGSDGGDLEAIRLGRSRPTRLSISILAIRRQSLPGAALCSTGSGGGGEPTHDCNPRIPFEPKESLDSSGQNAPNLDKRALVKEK